MFRIDNKPIKDRFESVSFNFYTDKEIENLSVKNILNPTTFDHLDNPAPQGLHDKHLGVSPFDRGSICPTCGQSSNFCPGHVGHISLVAPLYNPFMIKELYRLLKSKCFSCHRLRIHPQKIEAYTQALKLIKIGEVIESQTIKNYMLSMGATAVSQLVSSDKVDKKKLIQMKENLDQLMGVSKGEQGIDDIQEFFKKVNKKFSKMRRHEEKKIEEKLKSIEQSYGASEKKIRDQIITQGFTSIMQKCIVDITKEIWAQVVSINCPHCQAKSPSISKDGYTKFFVKSLSQKSANADRQRENLQSTSTHQHSSSLLDDEDAITHASSKGTSRKQSSHTQNQSELDEDHNVENPEANELLFDEDWKEASGQMKYISPNDVKRHIKLMWSKEKDLLNLMYGKHNIDAKNKEDSTVSNGYDLFFVQKVVVPPNRFRPESEGALGGAGGGGRSYLHQHSAHLLKILNCNLKLKDALLEQNKEFQNNANASSKLGETTQKWIQLQDAVNIFMDSQMAIKTADQDLGGIRQLLEKKEGMFRMKMMGKRVNFGARSVISPDPYITTDQIGVPVFMAKKLTYPESVNPHNAEKMRQLILNGSKIHPGANIVENEETGEQVLLEGLEYEQRESIAKQLTLGQKVVYRHLRTGDPLLVNRQPTLHRPSIMAHMARVLPKEQTIRMHYANCSGYNADFDGDEMNLHLPQSYQAVSEAYKLMATHKQYCVPTSGKPLRGLIQDSVVSGVFLSSKDAFLNKEQYMQLVYAGLRELIEDDKLEKVTLMQPQMFKPAKLWTGKQVISTLLKNICNQKDMTGKRMKKKQGLNLDSKSKLAAKEWGEMGKEMGDVIIRDNEHLVGTLDKSQFGSTDFGLVHSFYELYGSEKAGELLTALARVFAIYLQTYGFTVGLDDLMVTPEFNKERRMLIEKGHSDGMIAAAEFCEIQNFQPEKLNYSNRIVFQKPKNKKQTIDQDIERFNNMSIPENPFDNKQCIQKDNRIRVELERKMRSGDDSSKLDSQLDNRIKTTVNDATSKVNNFVVPNGLVKRFPKNNIQAMVLTGAKGGVVNQTMITSMLGQQELEGKRVPKMQNGKTLPCYLPYDPNPRSSGFISDRFLTGLRPQDFFFHCMSGREGLIDTAVKTSRSGYLQRCLIKSLESLVVNYDMTVRDNDGSIVQFTYGEDSIDVINTKFLDRFDFLEKNHKSLLSNRSEIIDKLDQNKVNDYRLQCRQNAKILKKEKPYLSNKEAIDMTIDPILSMFHPKKNFGAISDKMNEKLKKYIDTDCLHQQLSVLGDKAPKYKHKPVKPDAFRELYYIKYLKSVVDPGENVGTIAAQSIGEPSTQMTLNTFHLAGHGAENMTLGIPRLNEILMRTPVNIKTPTMTIYFNKDINISEVEARKFAYKFHRIKLSDVSKLIKVSQSIYQSPHDNSFSRMYKVHIDFEEAQQLDKNLGISFEQLKHTFSQKFIPTLMDEILKMIKKSAESTTSTTTTTLGHTTATSGATTGGLSSEVQLLQEEEMKIKEQKKSSKKSKDGAGEIRNQSDSSSENSSDDEDMSEKGQIAQKKQLYDNSEDVQNRSKMIDDQDDDMMLQDEKTAVENQEQEGGDPTTTQQSVGAKGMNQKYVKFIESIEFRKNKSATVQLKFPLHFKKILMLTLSEQVMQKILVSSVPGIEKCTFVKGDKPGDEPYMIVQGINFEVFQQHLDKIDVNRIETNHSYALKSKYGVEAMRANIVKEVRTVFKMYGIAVDYRHLSLIADFITFNGDYRAFNRIGMEQCSSPFLKMSFETTMKYLISSSQAQDTDDLSAPSSSIVLGQIPKVGTGIFDIIQQPQISGSR